MDENMKREVVSWIKLIVTAFVIAFVLRTYVFQIALVNQMSMEPTLHEGQVLIISKLNYLFGDPQRGNIVIVKDETEQKYLIKRAIGLPGEYLEIKNGHIYINGEELKPDYTDAPTEAGILQAVEIPANKYVVMGDNRMHSRDSRSDTVGFVDRKNIVGKAVVRIWPLNKLGILR